MVTRSTGGVSKPSGQWPGRLSPGSKRWNSYAVTRSCSHTEVDSFRSLLSDKARKHLQATACLVFWIANLLQQEGTSENLPPPPLSRPSLCRRAISTIGAVSMRNSEMYWQGETGCEKFRNMMEVIEATNATLGVSCSFETYLRLRLEAFQKSPYHAALRNRDPVLLGYTRTDDYTTAELSSCASQCEDREPAHWCRKPVLATDKRVVTRTATKHDYHGSVSASTVVGLAGRANFFYNRCGLALSDFGVAGMTCSNFCRCLFVHLTTHQHHTTQRTAKFYR